MPVTDTSVADVSDELPDFDLELPPGWARREVSPETLRAMVDASRRQCLQQHRPDLFPHLKLQLERSFEEMERAGVFVFFCPAEPGAGTLAIPSSIAVSVRTSTPDQSLDDLVRLMISHHGATPLLGSKQTLRMERERQVPWEDGVLINHTVLYLTPVPGTRRTRALQLVAAFPRDAETSAGSEHDGVRALLDLCVSTLRWSGSDGGDVS